LPQIPAEVPAIDPKHLARAHSILAEILLNNTATTKEEPVRYDVQGNVLEYHRFTQTQQSFYRGLLTRYLSQEKISAMYANLVDVPTECYVSRSSDEHIFELFLNEKQIPAALTKALSSTPHAGSIIPLAEELEMRAHILARAIFKKCKFNDTHLSRWDQLMHLACQDIHNAVYEALKSYSGSTSPLDIADLNQFLAAQRIPLAKKLQGILVARMNEVFGDEFATQYAAHALSKWDDADFSSTTFAADYIKVHKIKFPSAAAEAKADDSSDANKATRYFVYHAQGTQNASHDRKPGVEHLAARLTCQGFASCSEQGVFSNPNETRRCRSCPFLG
jgi:hypothetical protein